jgi:phosphatidylinositol dimannoside acyltransferase
MGLTRRLVWFAYPAYRVAEWLACRLPVRALSPVASVAAVVGMVTMPTRRRLVARHLRRVRGPELTGRDLGVAVYRAFRSYAGYWLDTFRLSLVDHDDLADRLTADGLEHLDAALAAGHGTVVAAPHLGSWDLGAAWLAGRGCPLVAVVERLEPPALLEWFIGIRRRHGLEVIVRGDDVWDRLREALAANKVVLLVSDRDLSGRGVPVEFFGEGTTLPAGPAKLARNSGAPLLPVAVYALGGAQHLGVVHAPVMVPCTDDERADVAAGTQALAGEFERLIQRSPEQWHLMQPNWPSD